jgi:hypothetical protein
MSDLSGSFLDCFSSTEDNSLAGRIFKCKATTNFHDWELEYYPEGCVKDLITPLAIRQELAKFPVTLAGLTAEKQKTLQKFAEEEYLEDLACWVFKNAQKTFALNLVCGHNDLNFFGSILIFKMRGFTDAKLSVVVPDSAEGQTIFDPKIWQPIQTKTFVSERWKFLAPVFSPTTYNYDLPERSIFPFTRDANVSKEGAFGSVFKVKIHPNHQINLDMIYVSGVTERHPGLR